MPIKPDGPNPDACLEKYKNQVVYINSFTVNQKEMLASILRVTDTKESDWKITKEPAKERYANGLKKMQEVEFTGFQNMKPEQLMGAAKMMYTRVFYPDGCGDFEHNKGTLNSLLGLPKENIDDATKVAVERLKK